MRKKEPPFRQREAIVRLAYTTAEKQEITQAARWAGLPVSVFARCAALREARAARPPVLATAEPDPREAWPASAKPAWDAAK